MTVAKNSLYFTNVDARRTLGMRRELPRLVPSMTAPIALVRNDRPKERQEGKD
jgi:hypothetical protein